MIGSFGKIPKIVLPFLKKMDYVNLVAVLLNYFTFLLSGQIVKLKMLGSCSLPL